LCRTVLVFPLHHGTVGHAGNAHSLSLQSLLAYCVDDLLLLLLDAAFSSHYCSLLLYDLLLLLSRGPIVLFRGFLIFCSSLMVLLSLQHVSRLGCRFPKCGLTSTQCSGSTSRRSGHFLRLLPFQLASYDTLVFRTGRKLER
jgi:hypothetical protein